MQQTAVISKIAFAGMPVTDIKTKVNRFEKSSIANPQS